MMLPTPHVARVVVAPDWHHLVYPLLTQLVISFADYAVCRLLLGGRLRVVGWAAGPHVSLAPLTTYLQFPISAEHPAPTVVRTQRPLLTPTLTPDQQARASQCVGTLSAMLRLGLQTDLAIPVVLRGIPGAISMMRARATADAYTPADVSYALSLTARRLEPLPASGAHILAFRPRLLEMEASQPASQPASARAVPQGR